MTTHARGTFDVQLHPLPLEEIAPDSMMGRMSIDKQFHGDLSGSSKGQMLSVGTTTTGSAVYVAVERVTATLGGKHGTFALYHNASMTRGAPALAIKVVPDSGTGDLAGISGSMNIDVKNGEHAYTFEYDLA